MSETGKPATKSRSAQKTFNLVLAGVVSQVGCLTLIIIFVALLAGLWLDNYFGTKPVLTVVLLVGSVPFTVIGMLWVVRQATSRIKPVVNEKHSNEETTEEVHRGGDA